MISSARTSRFRRTCPETVRGSGFQRTADTAAWPKRGEQPASNGASKGSAGRSEGLADLCEHNARAACGERSGRTRSLTRRDDADGDTMLFRPHSLFPGYPPPTPPTPHPNERAYLSFPFTHNRAGGTAGRPAPLLACNGRSGFRIRRRCGTFTPDVEFLGWTGL